MLRRNKKAVKNSHHKVYRPQLLASDISKQVIASQPPQIRFFANFAAELLIMAVMALATIWLLLLSYQPTTGSQTAAVMPITAQASPLAESAVSVPFLRSHPIARSLKTQSGSEQPTATKATDPACRQNVMNIVAHEDDDLLFINPRIAQAIDQQACVRTVYVTAGDDGRG